VTPASAAASPMARRSVSVTRPITALVLGSIAAVN
jgi:hypothetical protein